MKIAAIKGKYDRRGMILLYKYICGVCSCDICVSFGIRKIVNVLSLLHDICVRLTRLHEMHF